jgi:hypothetical protein
MGVHGGAFGKKTSRVPRDWAEPGRAEPGRAGAELSRAVPGEPGRAELCQAEPGRAEPGGDVLGGSPGGANVPHVVSLVLVRFVCRCKIESAIYTYINIHPYTYIHIP